MSAGRVVRLSDAEAVAGRVADELVSALADAQTGGRVATLVLTGGTISRITHARVAAHPDRDAVDWSRVEVFWGDERFVPADDPDRNAGQARVDLLSRLPFDPARVHEMPSSDSGLDVEQAAAAYDAELTEALADRASGGIGQTPWFDVLMLGIGPDGHCASLFPGRAEVGSAATVLAVRDSPKPPPTRISLGMSALGRAAEVWFVAAGAEKAAAVAASHAGGDINRTPSAGPRGSIASRWFVDEAAAPPG